MEGQACGTSSFQEAFPEIQSQGLFLTFAWKIAARQKKFRGVTHGDELIYLFSAGVFDLTFLDWEIARVITNLWANFVIHGYVREN